MEGHTALTASERLGDVSREFGITSWVGGVLLLAISVFIGQLAWAQAGVGIDTVIPLADVSTPANGDIVSTGVISISGVASDDASGVERVQVRVHRLGVSPAE